MQKPRNILICPLEWGLGHAARMIPLATRLRDMGNNIFIAAGEKHLALFNAEIKNVSLITFKGFSPGYSRYLPQYLFMLFKTPLLLWHIIIEHRKLKKLVKDNSIDIVISDNRFGLWHKGITTVYVTHLPRIPLPPFFRLFESTGVFLHRQVMKRYSYCFIPDLPGEINISGRLAHGLNLPGNVRYIGILSRFEAENRDDNQTYPFRHNTVILSGPEPQRSILKQKLAGILGNHEVQSVFLEGKPEEENQVKKSGRLIYYTHLAGQEMSRLVRSSDCIISRSGYTTIMDLVALNRSALLIPTPGQTEQEYLADYLSSKGWISAVSQRDLDHDLILPSIDAHWPAELLQESKVLLENALKELLE